jgi:hypothetical protein
MDRAAHYSIAVHQTSANPSDPERTASRIVATIGEGRHWYGQIGMARADPLWAWEIEVDTADDAAGAMSAFLGALAGYAMKVRYDYPRGLAPPADALACRGRAITNAFMPTWWIFSSAKLAAESHAALCAFIRGEGAPCGKGVRIRAPGSAVITYGLAPAGDFEMVRRFVRHHRPGFFTWANGHLPTAHPEGGKVVDQKATAFETFRANPHVWVLLEGSPASCHVAIGVPLFVGGLAFTPFFHDPQGRASWCVRADTQAVYAICRAESQSGAQAMWVPDGAADVEEFVARTHYENRAWRRR